MSEIKYIGQLQRLDVKPGDRFVITFDEHLSREGVEAITEAWKHFMGNDAPKVLVLTNGCKIGVIGSAEPDTKAS